MKLVNILCRECRYHSDFHREREREFSPEFPQGKIVDCDVRPQSGFVFCEKLAELASGNEYDMEMPADGFCSYGEPVPLKDITGEDKL